MNIAAAIEVAGPALVMLAVTIGPFDLAPVFIALTPRSSRHERRRLAIKAVTIASLLLLAFAFFGEKLMSALGIGFPAFRISGGVLLMLLAIDLAFARHSGLVSLTRPEEEEATIEADISVFPLAIPLIAGPGGMTAIVLLMGAQHGSAAGQAVVVAMLCLTMILTLVALLMADQLRQRLGVTGVTVLSRLSGMLLAALAVQFILDGLRQSGLFG